MASSTACSRCKAPNDRLPQRYCSTCHAADAKAQRQRLKDELAATKRENNELRKRLGPIRWPADAPPRLGGS